MTRKANLSFMSPMTPSATLAKIVGNKPLPRMEIVKRLWMYIRDNKLQDAKERRNINCDASLKELFGRSVVSMFEMAKHLSNHMTLAKKVNINKPKPSQQMAITPDSTRKALVLACAQRLLVANNTCSTLEIKLDLRKTQPAYFWTQAVVSSIMDGFSTAGIFTYTDNGTFRTYSDPTKTMPTSKTTRTKTTKTVAKVAKSASPKQKFTATISKRKAVNLMRNNKGHFFTVVFTKKEDGSTRTMNCQYLSGQTVDNSYVKVREASLIRANDPNPIRQFATNTLKSVSIAGTCYKVK